MRRLTLSGKKSQQLAKDILGNSHGPDEEDFSMSSADGSDASDDDMSQVTFVPLPYVFDACACTLVTASHTHYVNAGPYWCFEREALSSPV